MFEVRKAKRQRRPLKISLEGLSGSGKTYSALRLAFAMKRAGIGKRIVVADSENESAGLYDGVTLDGERWEYEVCPIPAAKQNPLGYAECYEYLVGAGFDIVVMDSLSHAWHGAQEKVDAHARANRGDKFGGWAQVTPEQRKMLTTLTDPRAHLIATMRVKSEYERTDEGGKAKIKKVGVKTDQRENTEYEFDCVVRLECGTHDAHVEKVRGCAAMDNRTEACPGPTFWKPLFDWWLSAEPIPEAAVWAKADFAQLMGRKGKGWANALTWIDKSYAQTYLRDGAPFDCVDPKHVAAYAARLLTLPDAPIDPPKAAAEGEQRADPQHAPATAGGTAAPTSPVPATGAAASAPAAPAKTDTTPGGQHAPAAVSELPRTGPELVRWAKEEAAGLPRPARVDGWIAALAKRCKLPAEVERWDAVAVERAALVIRANILYPRLGLDWTDLREWVNETELANYAAADGTDALTVPHLRRLVAELEAGGGAIAAFAGDGEAVPNG